MKLENYISDNEAIESFSDFRHQSCESDVTHGLASRYIADDLLDAMYVHNNIIDDKNLNASLFIGVFLSLHHLIRIYGREVQLEDSGYLDPLVFNLKKYPLDELLGTLTPGSRSLFQTHYEEVLQVFGPQMVPQTADAHLNRLD